MVMPGDNVSVEVELITPIAMEKSIGFSIREGGRTVGAGKVAEILDQVFKAETTPKKLGY